MQEQKRRFNKKRAMFILALVCIAGLLVVAIFINVTAKDERQIALVTKTSLGEQIAQIETLIKKVEILNSNLGQISRRLKNRASQLESYSASNERAAFITRVRVVTRGACHDDEGNPIDCNLGRGMSY